MSREESAMARGYARGRERDAAARAALKPLAPGERPLAIKLAVGLAVVLAVANVALMAAGYEVDGKRPVAGALIFAGIMLAAAWGMWNLRYWAVLGFQALLAIAVIFAGMSVLVASNVTAVALCLAIIALCGPLFWLLVRVMARIQLPGRPPHEPVS